MYTGLKRSARVKISRNVFGYPKYYPSDSDISQGYFTHNATQYTIPTSNELAVMDTSSYNTYIDALKDYVIANEFVSFENNFVNSNEEYDLVTCPSGLLDISGLGLDSDNIDAYLIYHADVLGTNNTELDIRGNDNPTAVSADARQTLFDNYVLVNYNPGYTP